MKTLRLQKDTKEEQTTSPTGPNEAVGVATLKNIYKCTMNGHRPTTKLI